MPLPEWNTWTLKKELVSVNQFMLLVPWLERMRGRDYRYTILTIIFLVSMVLGAGSFYLLSTPYSPLGLIWFTIVILATASQGMHFAFSPYGEWGNYHGDPVGFLEDTFGIFDAKWDTDNLLFALTFGSFAGFFYIFGCLNGRGPITGFLSSIVIMSVAFGAFALLYCLGQIGERAWNGLLGLLRKRLKTKGAE